MKIEKAIVTGPTGAVGYALIKELISNGVFVYAVSRKNSRRINQIPKSDLVKIVECNLDELNTLSSLINEDVDAFFHLAWDGTYGQTRQDLYLQCNNVKYTLDAVEIAHKLNCKVFIGAGSQSEFGHIDGILHPDTPCNPDNGYGIAKLMSCKMSLIKCKEYNIRHEWCRIVSLYGPNDGEYTLISKLIYALKNDEHFSATKCDQIWDYIYSKDAASAFFKVAENGKNGSIYVLGSGNPRKLKDYVNSVKEIMRSNSSIGFGEVPYYPNQVMHLEADISNLIEDTGYEARYSFEDGIKDLLEESK